MTHTCQAQLLFKFQCDTILVLQLSIGSYFEIGFLFLFEIGFNRFMPILHSCKPGLLKPFTLVISFYLRHYKVDNQIRY